MATISTHTHTQSLSLCGRSSIEFRNTATGKSAPTLKKTALNFSYWDGSFCNTLFHGQNWSFQQDSAPAHKAQTTQQWQETNVLDFISISDWPSASPYLNSLDYKLWSKLQEMACKKRHPNIESLKQSLRKAAADFPVDVLRNSIEGWPQSLKDCVCTNGGHFE